MSKKSLSITITVLILLIGTTGAGVYYWQSQKAKAEKQVLQNEIDKLKKESQLVSVLKNKITEVTELGSWERPQGPHGDAKNIHVVGNYAYVTYNDKLQTIDVSNPLSPTLVANYDTPGNVKDTCIFKNYICIVDWNPGYKNNDVSQKIDNFLIIDVSTPSSPKLVCKRRDATYNAGVDVVGNYIYLDSFHDELYTDIDIIDISNPSFPVMAGYFDNHRASVWESRKICIKGNYCYFIDSYQKFRIFDVSNPSSPTLVGTLDRTLNYADEICMEGNYAYVAGGDRGLQIIDVSNPSSPELVSDSDYLAYDIKVERNYAYVAAGDKGLQIIDVLDPSYPKLVGTYSTNGFARCVYVAGDYVYIVNKKSDKGMVIFRQQRIGAFLK